MVNLRWTILLGLTGIVAISCSEEDDPAGGGTAGTSSAGKGGAQGGASVGKGGSTGTAGGASLGGVPGASGTAGGASLGGSAGGSAAKGGGTQGGVGPGVGGTDDAGETGSGGIGGTPAGDGGAGGGETANTCVFPSAKGVAKALVPAGFCAWEWATDVSKARGITMDSAGNALVVSKGSVVALWDDDGDGVSAATERANIATATGLNHGIALHAGFLYASSASAVYRWAYTANRMPLGTPTTVVNAIPASGHATRTLAFDTQYMYVSVGSAANVDPNSDRARIRRFAITSLGTAPVGFATGEVFADGLRNEVGLRFDAQGRLWGVENGRDELARTDLGGDIHEDNPAEELNLFAEPGRFYGYPYCFTEFLLPSGVGLGNGTQWADPGFMNDGTHTDAWCRTAANVVPPVLSMQAHSAPLDILFYDGPAFPAEYSGDAFVTLHGSWNRAAPTGYKVIHIPFGSNGMPSGAPTPLFEYSGPGDIATEWPYRPVGLTTLPNGVLLVTSDASNTVLAIGYQG